MVAKGGTVDFLWLLLTAVLLLISFALIALCDTREHRP